MKKYILPYYDFKHNIYYVYNHNKHKNIKYKDYIDAINNALNISLKYIFYLKNKKIVTSTFENIIEYLYKYPESFNIKKDDYCYYSDQEMKYLNTLKERLLLCEVKDYPAVSNLSKKEIININKKRSCVPNIYLNNLEHRNSNNDKDQYNLPYYDIKKKEYFVYDNYYHENRTCWSLFRGLEECFYLSFYYSYNIDSGNGKINHNHSHSFCEVIQDLCSSPNGFEIFKKDLEFYSIQQLEYVNAISKKLLELNIDNFKRPENEKLDCLYDKYNSKKDLFSKLICKIIDKKYNKINVKYKQDRARLKGAERK